ncbi:MAG: LuxR C-terminal-related transcriptional regulator [Chloroflexota bacterium]
MLTPVRVLLADHVRLSRRSLVNLLRANKRIRVVAEASGALEALSKMAETQPDVGLVESGIPDLSRDIISKMSHWTKVIVLAETESPEQMVRYLRAGARGYVGKDIEPESLFHCIYCVASGGVVATPSAVTKVLDVYSDTRIRPRVPRPRVAEGPVLTAREIQTLELVAQGATNREIGEALAISESTVKTHLRNILDKLRLNNKAQAAVWATQTGLVRLDQQAGWQETPEVSLREPLAMAEGA